MTPGKERCFHNREELLKAHGNDQRVFQKGEKVTHHLFL